MIGFREPPLTWWQYIVVIVVGVALGALFIAILTCPECLK